MSDERIATIDTLLTAQEERMAQGYITGSISVVDARYLLDHNAALETRNQQLEDVAAAAGNTLDSGYREYDGENERYTGWLVVDEEYSDTLKAALDNLAAGEGTRDG